MVTDLSALARTRPVGRDDHSDLFSFSSTARQGGGLVYLEAVHGLAVWAPRAISAGAFVDPKGPGASAGGLSLDAATRAEGVTRACTACAPLRCSFRRRTSMQRRRSWSSARPRRAGPRGRGRRWRRVSMLPSQGVRQAATGRRACGRVATPLYALASTRHGWDDHSDLFFLECGTPDVGGALESGRRLAVRAPAPRAGLARTRPGRLELGERRHRREGAPLRRSRS